MPDRSRIRWSQLKVGIVALSALIILAVLILLLTNSTGLFRTQATLYTYMEDASGVVEKTPVRLNGISIGWVDHIRLTNSPQPRHQVEFEMKVYDRFLKDIPVDSVAGISAANLLGEKFINIARGTSKQTVQSGAALPSSPNTNDIPELTAQMNNVLQSFQTIVARADNLLAGVEAGKGNIGKLLKDEEFYDRLTAIENEGENLLKAIRTSNGTLGKLIYDPALYNDVDAPLKRIDAILAGLQAGQGTAGKLLNDQALYTDLQSTVGEIRTLVAQVNTGQGTLGMAVKDPALYNRLNDLLGRFSTIVDKINAGQGTLGQFIVNPQLYNSLNAATGQLEGLAKDVRANPKKFLTLRLALF
jgi:phospholipid/cholesterol/gamma-HCH transport system substrate-binding protein